MIKPVSRLLSSITITLTIAAIASAGQLAAKKTIPERDGTTGKRITSDTIQLQIHDIIKRTLSTQPSELDSVSRAESEKIVDGSVATVLKDNVAIDVTWSVNPPADVTINQFDIRLETTNTDGSTTVKESDSKHLISGSARRATLSIHLPAAVLPKSLKLTLIAHVQSRHTNGTNLTDNNRTNSGQWTLCAIEKTGSFSSQETVKK